MNNTKDTSKRMKRLVSMPEMFWNALDNKMDGCLIRTYGDAIISLISDLQKISPGAVKLTPHVDKNAEMLAKVKEITGVDLTQVSESMLAIELGDMRISRELNEKYRAAKKEISQLKQRLGEGVESPKTNSFL